MTNISLLNVIIPIFNKISPLIQITGMISKDQFEMDPSGFIIFGIQNLEPCSEKYLIPMLSFSD